MKIIVDLFNQHSGDLTELKRMALSAFMSGADAVKLQLLDSQRIWGDSSREYLEMKPEDIYEFSEYCKTIGVEFSATAFNEEKFDILEDIGVDFYKIASVTAKNDPDLCKRILESDKMKYISLGKFDKGEFPFGHRDDVRYLYCVSEYPTILDNEKVKNMPDRFHDGGYYGYSDHCLGMGPSIVAATRGAALIEKHFTMDTNAQSEFEKAHLCSFTPETLSRFKNLVREIQIAGLIDE